MKSQSSHSSCSILQRIGEKFRKSLKTITAIVLIAIVLKSSLISNRFKGTSESDANKTDWHDWDRINADKFRTSIGEHGVPTYLQSYPSSSKGMNDTYGFNGYLSDKIALNRSLMDLRPTEYVLLISFIAIYENRNVCVQIKYQNKNCFADV